jgi:hypothetical protein
MRSRVLPLVSLCLLLVPVLVSAPAAVAGPAHVLAQGGQGKPETETGAQNDSGGAVEETGPPWTYQMAKLSVVLLVLLGGAIFFLYYKLVVQRRRGEV